MKGTIIKLFLLLSFVLLSACCMALVSCTTDAPSNETTGSTGGESTSPDTFGTDHVPEKTEPTDTEAQTTPDTEAETTPDTEEITTAPQPDDTPEVYTYKHVVIVGVDGAGTFFQNADTPNLDRIFENGAVSYKALTSNPSISAQSWGSLFHGVIPSLHGLTNAVVEATPYPIDSPFPSFMRVVREQIPDATLGSLCKWNSINVGIVEDGLDIYKYGGVADALIIEKACEYVNESAPTVLFIQLDEADGVGHREGYNTPAQLAKISEQDALIGELYDTYVEKGIIEDTLFIVTADHGGTGNSHGGWTDAEKYIMFAAAGKTVTSGEIQDMEIRDTAAIVCHALGLTAPSTWSARVPSGLFKGVTASERPVYNNPTSDRYHEPTPTPAKGSDGYITNFITDKTLKTYLTFDGNITDACGTATEQGGKLYFVDGYFGKGVELSDGYIQIPDYAPAKDSFTVSLWVATQGTSGDPVLFSNKNWFSGTNRGYVLCLWGNERKIRFNVGDGGNRMDSDYLLPSDFFEGWMHILLVVDREAGMIRFSYDFGPLVSTPIPEALKNDSFSALDQLCIGQDGTGEYKLRLSAVLDEFMLFEGAFTNDDVVKLAEYYGKESSINGVRNRESTPTPEVGSDGYITNFITDKTLTTYLTFDGNPNDACNQATVTEKGTVTYEDGFYGQAATLGKGYVSIADFKPGKDSFSIALWVKTTGVTSDPSLISNKNWANGVNKGFILALRDKQDLRFNIGDGTNRADKPFALPSDYRTGWVHVVLVVDREAGVVKLSYDFDEFQTLTLPNNLKDTSFDAFEVLNIGQDGTGNYSASCTATVDEFMLFDGVLSEEDLTALAKYYGI